MKISSRHLLVHHDDPVLHECVRRLHARGEYEVVLTEGWSDLMAAVGGCPASCIAVVDPAGGDVRGGIADQLVGLMSRFPSLTVLAAVYPRRGSLNHLRSLGELGVVQIIDLEEDRTAALVRERLEQARARPLQRLVSNALPPNTSGYARSIINVAAQVALEGGAATHVAERLHITPRTLTRWCRRAALPAPRQLLAWMRTLVAAELLDDPGRTVQDAAVACGYASHVSLRQALRTFLGMSPTELREQGAFSVASREMVAAFEEARKPGKRYRSQSRRSEHT